MVVWDARSVFPNVDFFGTKIHSSDSLTELQKQNLTIINNIIGTISITYPVLLHISFIL